MRQSFCAIRAAMIPADKQTPIQATREVPPLPPSPSPLPVVSNRGLRSADLDDGQLRSADLDDGGLRFGGDWGW